MKKYLFLISFLLFFYASSFAQFSKEQETFLYAKIDSLKKAAPKLNGRAKVDCLNTIVDQYQIMDEDNQMQIDSAGPYAMQSLDEAKRIGYKRGLGYAYLKMSYLRLLRAVNYKRKNPEPEPGSFKLIQEQLDQAMQIAGDINDNIMAGSAYALTAWLEQLKGYDEQHINILKKGISLIENNLATQPKGQYSEMDYTHCIRCTGEEFRLGELYSGLSYSQTNESEKMESLKKAIIYYKKSEADPAVVNIYIGMISTLFTADKLDKGIEILKQADEYFQTKKNDSSKLALYLKLSAFFWGLGDFENGLEYSRRSVRIVENLEKDIKESNNKNIEWGQVYFWMGRFYRLADDYITALKFFQKAHDYYPVDNKSVNILWAIETGKTYGKMGNYDSAIFYLEPFAKNESSPIGAKAYLGDLYISMGQFDKALPLINECIDAETKFNGIANLTGLYTNAAKIYLGKMDYQSALTNARRSIVLLSKTKRNTILIETYSVLSDIFSKLGKHDSAYIYLKKYTGLKDSLFNKQLYIRLNDLKREAEEERKISQINLLNKDNQLKEQKLKQQATLRNGLIIGIILILLLGVFIFRNLWLKRKNDKLRMQKDFEVQRLESEKKQAELHQRAVELEMQALRAQMNPHFIFNCLSSINRFIFKNDNKTASDYLTRFSRLIRMVLMHSQRKLIPLEDELEMIRLYLDLERLRFKDAFNYSITTTNIVDAGNIFLPPLLLQPFCENAVWHGLMHKDGKGHLNVMISEVINENDRSLLCVIEDDGVGRERAAELKSKSAESEKSMGLKITTERLALLNQENNLSTFYKIDDIVNEENEVTGTKVQLKIKYKESIEEYAQVIASS